MRCMILAAVLVAITACASQNSSQAPLYSTYNKYRHTLTHENSADRALEFFFSSILADHDLTDPEIIGSLIFYEDITTEFTHNESFRARGHCLAVYGVNEDGEHISCYIRYIKQKSIFLIDELEVFVDGLGLVDRGEVLCPGELAERPLPPADQWRRRGVKDIG